jgi:hypothetical protein
VNERHGDPGEFPPALDDEGLEAMLSLQDVGLAAQAITVANFAVCNRQSANPLYYKTVARKARLNDEATERKGRAFRQHVWWFVQHSPKTRAKAREKEQKAGGNPRTRRIGGRPRRAAEGRN